MVGVRLSRVCVHGGTMVVVLVVVPGIGVHVPQRGRRGERQQRDDECGRRGAKHGLECTVPVSARQWRYFQVISMPKKWRNTWRFGRFFAFCCGLRM